MEFVSPNTNMLRQLYMESKVAKAFFDHAARRERDQSETKVDRILVLLRAEGHEFRRREIIELFRKLQDQGCGQFVEGRRGWPSRFVWSTGITSVGKAASGDLQIIEHISTEDSALHESVSRPISGSHHNFYGCSGHRGIGRRRWYGTRRRRYCWRFRNNRTVRSRTDPSRYQANGDLASDGSH